MGRCSVVRNFFGKGVYFFDVGYCADAVVQRFAYCVYGKIQPDCQESMITAPCINVRGFVMIRNVTIFTRLMRREIRFVAVRCLSQICSYAVQAQPE